MKDKLIIEIIEHYGTEDKEFTGECSTDLVIDNKVVLLGDQYHNKIQDRIEGFLECLDYLKIKYTKNKLKKADEPLWD